MGEDDKFAQRAVICNHAASQQPSESNSLMTTVRCAKKVTVIKIKHPKH